MIRWWRARTSGSCEEGSSLIELALTLPVLAIILLGAIDFGRAFFLATEVAGAAHAGAEYGVQNPTDVSGMKTAAQDDAPDVPNLAVATPTYGCECSDGTGFVASCTTTPLCTSNVVYRVSVGVTATYSTWLKWPGIPASIALSNTAVMRSGGS